MTCYAPLVKLKQRPEDFVVREGSNFESDPDGPVWIYRMDKQKISTLQALERIGKEFGVRRRALSICGLKDKQGRTEQLIGVEGGALGMTDVVQSGDLRLTLIDRAASPLSSANVTANRFEVTIRDLKRDEAERVPESVREVERCGVVNYFDSQRFGFLKHGQGFIGKQLIRGDFEGALKSFLATPSHLDHSDDAKVKAFWRDNWGQWRLFAPHKAGAIYAPMLRRLRSDPQDFKGAFLHIERRTRMMTLFELQSYLWNEGVRRYLLGLLPAAELIGLRYQAGALILPRTLPLNLREELRKKTFPLLAWDSKFTDPAVEAAALSALASQGLKLEQLRVPETPQLFFKHEERPLFVQPGKLRVSEARPDEMNRGMLKLTLSFTLPPGAYATLVVRRVFWFAAEGARELGPHGSGAAQASKARGKALEREKHAAALAAFEASLAAKNSDDAADEANLDELDSPGAHEEVERFVEPASAPVQPRRGKTREERQAQDRDRAREAKASREASETKSANLAPAPTDRGAPAKKPKWGQPLESADDDRAKPRQERSASISSPARPAAPATSSPARPAAAAAKFARSESLAKPERAPIAETQARTARDEHEHGDDETPNARAASIQPAATQPLGFLARQRARKASREARRADVNEKVVAKKEARKKRK